MAKAAKICSVRRDYANDYSLEGSLNKNGYNRFPGTGIRLVPFKEANGHYRTGLDPDAIYITRMPQAEQETERARVTSLRDELEAKSGFKDHTIRTRPDGTISLLDLSPTSDYYAKMFDQEAGNNNRARVVKLVEGDNIFNLDNPFDAITFAWLRVHPQVASSYEAYRTGKAGQVQFYVSDPEVENDIIFREKNVINKAIADLENMSPKKRRTVARLLGLPVSDETRDQNIYNLLDTFIKEGTVKNGEFKGQKSVNLFTDILKMKDDNVHIKDIVKQAFTYSIYRRKAGGKVYEGELEIAKNEQELIEFMLQPKNQDDFLALEEKIKSKKSIAQ